jgi:hypothetical protein
MSENRKKPTLKKAAKAAKDEAVESALSVVKDDKSAMQEIQEELAEHVYSYMERQPDNTFRRRSFKYKDRTEKDVVHFFNQIIEQWNSAPVDSRVHFMLSAFPAIRSFLKKSDPELLMLMLHDPEKDGEKVN